MTTDHIIKKGWTVLEDCGFKPAIISPNQLELVSPLIEDERYINYDTLFIRAKDELDANMGKCHAEFMLKHYNDIPAGFRQFYLLFTGTVRRDSKGMNNSQIMFWNGSRWCLEFFTFERNTPIGNDHRLLHLRRG